MAGPAYYSGAINIAKNEDWIVPFAYGSVDETGSNFTPIDLTGSTIMMEFRKREGDHEAIVSLASPNNGVIITDAVGGTFTILIARGRLWRMAPGDYVTDIVRLAPNGYQERLWEGIASVVEGTTR